MRILLSILSLVIAEVYSARSETNDNPNLDFSNPSSSLSKDTGSSLLNVLHHGNKICRKENKTGYLDEERHLRMLQLCNYGYSLCPASCGGCCQNGYHCCKTYCCAGACSFCGDYECGSGSSSSNTYTNPSSSSTSSSSTSSSSSSSSSDGPSAGRIAGIVISILSLVLCAYRCCCRNRKKEDDNSHSSNYDDDHVPPPSLTKPRRINDPYRSNNNNRNQDDDEEEEDDESGDPTNNKTASKTSKSPMGNATAGMYPPSNYPPSYGNNFNNSPTNGVYNPILVTRSVPNTPGGFVYPPSTPGGLVYPPPPMAYPPSPGGTYATGAPSYSVTPPVYPPPPFAPPPVSVSKY